MSINYILATVTESTNLLNQTIFVDDTNPEIFWDGSWEMTTNVTFAAKEVLSNGSLQTTIADKLPHGNGTHVSSKIGDSFTFKFAGTSILVSGVSPNAKALDVSGVKMTFNLDGEIFDQDLPGDQSGILMHRVYFHNDSLSSGDHTLIGNVTDVTSNGTAIIDYMAYTASFDNLADKPTFGANSSSPGASPGESMGLVIAGGLLGAFLSFGFFGLGFWYLRKSQKKQKNQNQTIHQPNFIVEPFTSMPTSDAHIPPRKGDMVQSSAKGLHISSVNHQSSDQIHDSVSHSQDLQREDIYPTESASNVSGSSNTTESRDELAARIREMHMQMGIMTREINRFMVPPAYVSQDGSALEGRQENIT
ncbi:hypothetical protein VKT23_006144 [Stygiomarasmius scandens]|uniref:Uncharacterized protein n=1 Tax=Marasmiellus scandens TaxID=2682957 RepID=A0ABR1JPB7_9AGAR